MTFSESSEVGLARFFSNRGSKGGGGFSIHTPIPSQLPDASETITVGGLYPKRSQASWARSGASRSRGCRGGNFMRGAPRVPLLIRLGAFDAHCRFLLLLLAVQEWPESKAAIQIRFHLNQLEEQERDRERGNAKIERERERETVCQPPSSQIQKILPRKKGGVSGLREAQRNPEEFPRIFFSLLLHISLPSSSRSG